MRLEREGNQNGTIMEPVSGVGSTPLGPLVESEEQASEVAEPRWVFATLCPWQEVHCHPGNSLFKTAGVSRAQTSPLRTGDKAPRQRAGVFAVSLLPLVEVKSRAGDYTNRTVQSLLEQRGLLGRKRRYVSVEREAWWNLDVRNNLET